MIACRARATPADIVDIVERSGHKSLHVARLVLLQQYAGRLHREHATKTDVRIIDFVDTGHPALLRMWDKRQCGYKAMGYRMA